MSESGSETPKTLKRMRNEREATYRQRKKKISDLLRRHLVLKSINSLKKSRRAPCGKYHISCNDIQNDGRNGGQILSTLRNEIVKFRNDTVAVMKGGLKKVLE